MLNLQSHTLNIMSQNQYNSKKLYGQIKIMKI